MKNLLFIFETFKNTSFRNILDDIMCSLNIKINENQITKEKKSLKYITF